MGLIAKFTKSVIAFHKNTYELTMPDGPSTISALNNAIDQAEKTRKLILHSDLLEKDRLQIDNEMLSLIDDIQKLQTTRLMEVEMLCQI